MHREVNDEFAVRGPLDRCNVVLACREKIVQESTFAVFVFAEVDDLIWVKARRRHRRHGYLALDAIREIRPVT
jgi:hypothetical protein